MHEKESKHVFYITHSIEILFWLIVILVIIFSSMLFFYTKEKNNNDYHIFLPDVDGLIVGSSVRIMGIDVGYITEIKPTAEEVFVKFLIKDKNLHIPQGTIATVEFSGMAGSKSLELYLPTKNTYIDSSTPIITVTQPKRLHDALGLLNDMFDKLGSIIYSSSSFSKNLKDIDMPHSKEQDFKRFLNYSDIIIDESTKRAKFLQRKLEKYEK